MQRLEYQHRELICTDLLWVPLPEMVEISTILTVLHSITEKRTCGSAHAAKTSETQSQGQIPAIKAFQEQGVESMLHITIIMANTFISVHLVR